MSIYSFSQSMVRSQDLIQVHDSSSKYLNNPLVKAFGTTSLLYILDGAHLLKIKQEERRQSLQKKEELVKCWQWLTVSTLIPKEKLLVCTLQIHLRSMKEWLIQQVMFWDKFGQLQLPNKSLCALIFQRLNVLNGKRNTTRPFNYISQC